MYVLPEDQHDAMATYGEAAREYACNAGAERPEREWILTDWDSWERNPHYRGPAGPHPEDMDNCGIR